MIRSGANSRCRPPLLHHLVCVLAFVTAFSCHHVESNRKSLQHVDDGWQTHHAKRSLDGIGIRSTKIINVCSPNSAPSGSCNSLTDLMSDNFWAPMLASGSDVEVRFRASKQSYVLSTSIQLKSCGINSGTVRFVGFSAAEDNTNSQSVTLDGQGQTRLFQVSGGCKLMLRNLVLINGGNRNAPVHMGSSVVAIGDLTSLELQDCSVKGGVAFRGGGLLVADGAQAIVRDCAFLDNSAIDDGFMIGQGHDFADAYGVAGDVGGYGGAAAVVNASAEFSRTSFESNRALASEGQPPPLPYPPGQPRVLLFGGGGGALAVLGQNSNMAFSGAQLIDCNFDFNEAKGNTGIVNPQPTATKWYRAMAGMGGAIIAMSSRLEMRGGRVNGNAGLPSQNQAAPDGGGVFLHGGNDPSSVHGTFKNVTFSGNIAYGAPVQDGAVGGFSGGEAGAVMVLRATAEFLRCVFEGNEGRGYSQSNSPDIAIGQGGQGGAITVGSNLGEPAARAWFTECVFRGNVARLMSASNTFARGGAIYVQNAHAFFYRCFFISNVARGVIVRNPQLVDLGDKVMTTGRGGAIYALGEPARVEVSDSVFESNHASAGLHGSQGGAIHANSVALLKIIRSKFVSNYAQNAFPLSDHTISIQQYSAAALSQHEQDKGSGLQMSPDIQAVGAGGAVFTQGAKSIVINDSEFSANVASFGKTGVIKDSHVGSFAGNTIILQGRDGVGSSRCSATISQQQVSCTQPASKQLTDDRRTDGEPGTATSMLVVGLTIGCVSAGMVLGLVKVLSLRKSGM